MARLTLLLLVASAVACIHPRVIDDGKLNPVGLKKVADETEQLRQLPYLREIPSYAVRGKDLGRFLKLELDLMGEHLDAETALYQQLGILREEQSLRQMYEGIYQGNTAVAGFYTWSGGGQLYVLENYAFSVRAQLELIGWITGTDWAYELTLSHELIHALQDQHLDLAAQMPLAMERHDGDRAWAVRSIIESEANFFGWGHFHALPLEGWLARRMHAAYILFNYAPFLLFPKLAFPGAPVFFTKLSLGNYTRGLGWVIARLDEGGRARLDQALREEMPKSTEQLLFPDELDEPHHLARLELDGVTLSDCFGALRLMTLLEEHTSLPGSASEIARAWDGDRIELIQRGDERVMLWRFVMEDEKSARALGDVWARYQEARGLEHASVTVDGKHVFFVEGADKAEFLPAMRAAMASVEAAVYVADNASTPPLKDRPDGIVQKTTRPIPAPRTANRGPADTVREQVFLPARTMAWRAGVRFRRGFDGERRLLLEGGELRWGIRENLEFTLPFGLTLRVPHPLGDVLINVGLDGVFPVGPRFGVSYVLRQGPIALAAQLQTSALFRFDEAAPDLGTARVSLSAFASPHRRVALAFGVAQVYFVDVGALATKGTFPSSSILEVGSAWRRGGRFAQPLVEVEVIDILHTYLEGSLLFDTTSGELVDERIGGGVILYF